MLSDFNACYVRFISVYFRTLLSVLMQLLRELHESEKLWNRPTLQVYEMDPCLLVVIISINHISHVLLVKVVSLLRLGFASRLFKN